MHDTLRPKENSVEIEGNTVEDAIKKAVMIFGVSRNDLNIKIMCEGKGGLFGMAGGKLVKIKANLKNKN